MMRLGIFLQVGFLALTALFLALTVYYNPIPSIGAAMLAICVAASALGCAGTFGPTTIGGCLGVVILIFGSLYGVAYLLFCIGGRCA